MNTVDQLLPAAEEVLDLPLLSVAKRKRDVFASNQDGLFWADLAEKRWLRLPTPATMPLGLGGDFASVPEDAKVIVYSLNRHWPESWEPGKVYGIYLSRNAGRTWHLIAEGVDYGPVLLHPNGSLFACWNAGHYEGDRSQLHVSHDLGTTWRELPNAHFGGIVYIEVDSIYPGQVRLFTADDCIIRVEGDQFHDESDSRSWQGTWEEHLAEFYRRQRFEDFFSYQASGWTYHLLPASLRNYFDHEFGNRTELPAIDLSVDGTRFEFQQGERVKVPITIRFRENLPTAWCNRKQNLGENCEPPTPTVLTLVDQLESAGDPDSGLYYVWTIRLQHAGKRIVKETPAYEIVRAMSERRCLEAEIHAETYRRFPCRRFRLSAAEPFRRTLDLGRLHDFSAPGLYHVQLKYDSGWVGDRSAGDWVGYFNSSVFEVEIRP